MAKGVTKSRRPIGLTNSLLIILILLVFFGFYGTKVSQYYNKRLLPLIHREITTKVGRDIYECNFERKLDVEREYQKCVDEGKRSGKAYGCVQAATEKGITQIVHPIMLSKEYFLGILIRQYEYVLDTPQPSAMGITNCKFVKTERT